MILLEALLQVFTPFDCLSCSAEGRLLCDACQGKAAPMPVCCYRCLKSSTRTRICDGCASSTSLVAVHIAVEYGAEAQKLIHAVKFGRAKSGTALIAQVMHARLPLLPRGTVITYIPTANRRVRERGYDQAALIARRFARLRNLPYQQLLRRHGHARQVGATRRVRQQQLEGAFSLRRSSPSGVSVLIVDDVITTGATIEKAAQILLDGGVNNIMAAAFVQKT